MVGRPRASFQGFLHLPIIATLVLSRLGSIQSLAVESPALVDKGNLVGRNLVRPHLSEEGHRRMTIDLEGTINSIKFQPSRQGRDVMATITIECHPNELEAGALSRLAGKNVEVSITSRQIPLPLTSKQEQPEYVDIDID